MQLARRDSVVVQCIKHYTVLVRVYKWGPGLFNPFLTGKVS